MCEYTITRHLTCCVCGYYAGHFEQWPNQDAGFSICPACVVRVQIHEAMPAEQIERYYGVAGVNYEAPVREIVIEPATAKNFFDDTVSDYKAGIDQWREITQENYYYGLEVLPPIDWARGGFLMGEPYKHTEWDVIYTGFVKIGDRYFAREIGRKQFEAAAAALSAKVR